MYESYHVSIEMQWMLLQLFCGQKKRGSCMHGCSFLNWLLSIKAINQFIHINRMGRFGLGCATRVILLTRQFAGLAYVIHNAQLTLTSVLFLWTLEYIGQTFPIGYRCDGNIPPPHGIHELFLKLYWYKLFVLLSVRRRNDK